MQVEADSKRYEAAKTHAAEALAAAERAIANGEQAASRAKNEAQGMLAGLRPALEETERNLNGARYNQLNLDYNQLNSDLNTARNTIDAAEADNARAKYQDALEKGRTARATLGNINEKISGATPRRKS
jgi:multidrug resistance efflux pump